jgi:peroxiredoxin
MREDIAMKRYLIAMTVVLAVLLMAWVVFAQEAGRETPAREGGRRGRLTDVNRPAGPGAFEGLSPEERAKMRERFGQMSEEEREKFRAQMRERPEAIRPLLGREEQLKVVAAIEEQLTKLKEFIKSQMGPEEFAKLRELAAEERTKMREKLTQTFEERRKILDAIEQQIARLRGERQRIEDPQRIIGDLQALRELAVQEKAQETTKRIDQLIEQRQKEIEQRFRGPLEGPARPPRAEGGRETPMPSVRKPEGAPESQGGKKAPDFTLKSFDGKTVKLFDYQGKIVVLEWFNFECPYVMGHYGQKKTMVELANKYKDKNVVWLAVNSTSHITVESNKKFAAEHKLPYPILDDRAGAVGHAYGAQTTPHIFIIDSAGNIVYNGAIDNAPLGKTAEGQAYVNYVDKALEELTAGKAVTTASTKPYGCTVKYPR